MQGKRKKKRMLKILNTRFPVPVLQDCLSVGKAQDLQKERFSQSSLFIVGGDARWGATLRVALTSSGALVGATLRVGVTVLPTAHCYCHFPCPGYKTAGNRQRTLGDKRTTHP
jgi:hypothetical protein